MSQILRIGLVVCLAIGLLWVDVSIPLGVAIGVLYAALVFLGSTVGYGLMPVIALLLVLYGIGPLRRDPRFGPTREGQSADR